MLRRKGRKNCHGRKIIIDAGKLRDFCDSESLIAAATKRPEWAVKVLYVIKESLSEDAKDKSGQ